MLVSFASLTELIGNYMLLSNLGIIALEMAELHSTLPRAITYPFPHAFIPKLHSKACNFLY